MKIKFTAPGVHYEFESEGRADSAEVKVNTYSPFAIRITLHFPNGRTRAEARYLLSTKNLRMLRHTNEFKIKPSKTELDERQKTLAAVIHNPLTLQCIHGYFGSSA